MIIELRLELSKKYVMYINVFINLYLHNYVLFFIFVNYVFVTNNFPHIIYECTYIKRCNEFKLNQYF